MDLFTIIGTVWKHKIATLPVILIVLIGASYIVVLKPPTYSAAAEILLANPPAPPSAAQVAADPKLGKINTNNPYLGYGNLVLVADVVIDLVNSPAVQERMAKQGANPKYTVSLENAFENPPVIQASGTGASPAEAIKSAQVVAEGVLQSLQQIQTNQNVNPAYMITGQEFVKPQAATSSSSGKLRTLIGILAAGLVLLLLAVSIAQSLENRKRRHVRDGEQDGPQGSEGSYPQQNISYQYDQQMQPGVREQEQVNQSGRYQRPGPIPNGGPQAPMPENSQGRYR